MHDNPILSCRLRLVDQGYRITPIRTWGDPRGRGKAPYLPGWQRLTATAEDAATWRKTASTGIICGQQRDGFWLIAVDIDIPDHALAPEVEAKALELIGPTDLIRVGRAPKRLLVYRDLGRHRGTKLRFDEGGIEILADGNQFVAYGIHPATGRPYEWITGDSPESVALEDVPLAKPGGIATFLDWCQKRLTPVKTTGRFPDGRTVKGDQTVVFDEDGKVTDGREAVLRDAIFEAFLETLPNPTIQGVADRAWDLFSRRAVLRDGKWRWRDAYRKAQGTIRRWKVGELDQYLSGTPQPPFYPDTAVPLDEAERRTSAAIGSFLHRALAYDSDSDAPPPAEVLRVGTGIGKTEAKLEVLAVPELAGESIVYLLPEHALADEVADRFTAKSVPRGGPRALVIRGRDRTHSSGDPMCRKADLAEEVARRNGNVMTTLCHRKVRNGCAEEFCEHHPAVGGSCRYIQQMQDTGPAVRFMPTTYAFMPKPEGLPAPRLTVMDETFWQSALRGTDGRPEHRPYVAIEWLRETRYVPRRDEFGDDLDTTAALRATTFKLLTVLDAGPLSPAALRAAGLTAAECRSAAKYEYRRMEKLDIRPAMSAAEQRQRLAASRTQSRVATRLGRFWTLLAEELEHTPDRDRMHSILPGTVGTDAVSVLFMRWSADLAEHIRKSPVLVLDATADATILRRFLPQMADPVAIEAEWPHVEVIQATDTVTPKYSLVPTEGATPEERRRRANRRTDLRRLIEVEVAKAGGPRPDGSPAVLAVSYKKAVLDDNDAPLIEPVPGADFAWFNAVRGKDGWRDIDTLIVAGRTRPNAGDVEAITAALFYRDPESIAVLGTDRYPQQRRGYRLADGSRHDVLADHHPDPRCEAVRWQICEAELLQVIGRGRPARRTADRPLRVILLQSVPLPVTVTQLTTRAELLPDPVDLMIARGIVPEAWADIEAVLGDLFTTSDDQHKPGEAARKTLDRLRIADRSLWEETYRGLSAIQRVRYRVAGRRKGSTAWIDLARHPDLRAALERLLGPLDRFEVIEQQDTTVPVEGASAATTVHAPQEATDVLLAPPSDRRDAVAAVEGVAAAATVKTPGTIRSHALREAMGILPAPCKAEIIRLPMSSRPPPPDDPEPPGTADPPDPEISVPGHRRRLPSTVIPATMHLVPVSGGPAWPMRNISLCSGKGWKPGMLGG